MFKYLFFCCSSNIKEPAHTVTLEDINNISPLITKNSENLNYATQSNTNNNLFTETNNNKICNKIINIEEKKENEKEKADNIILKHDKKEEFIDENENDNNNDNLFKRHISKTHILTINNINNININFHGEEKQNNQIKHIDKIEHKKGGLKLIEELPKLKKLKTEEKGKEKEINKEISVEENSKEIIQQNRSFISFSNITIKYNTGGDSSLNLSDTEILSSCELTLTGDLFFNKEIKIDRGCIKNNGIQKSRNKKTCEIKFGLVLNGGENKSSYMSEMNEEKNNKNERKNSNIKSSKISNIKSKQKKKIQKFSSFSSIGNNAINNKSLIDIILNLPYNKVQKKLNENNGQNKNNSNNKNNNNENIILFILKYDLNLDIFQLISFQDSLPVQLLLNYNFPLKFHQNYYILIGGIKIKIRVIKNEKNESILNIYTNNNNDKKKGEKSYSFNPIKDKMPITIGRNICNINLDNISVSKVHAQIDYIFEYDEFFIIDCDSTNGTYLLLQDSVNSIYIKQDLCFKLCESSFRIYYTNFEK